ncbi:hypothetical protein [Bacteroides sp. 519]|uniref:hypothetical protein n=1 Tax=Bacteroides sp. 519 TaxID=2302937 RepID=UPI0013D5BABE|nr:hypothetical protein [Bacteroides sp. 519]NDV56517.1 hypothetical protein [Bacteroides sp. 519]
MKKYVTIVSLLILLIACNNNGEKKAMQLLENARTSFSTGDYNTAKLKIDSIKILYPKAFEVRKEGIKLMQQVELSEQTQTIAYLDSMLQQKQKEFEEIKNKFVLEKDSEYQETGNYFWPTQVVEKNLNRSFLRFQVDEHGTMTMTSIYCGAKNIHHVAIKVTAPDGTFAETPASNDSYETTDMGQKIEKADYKLGQDGNVIGFIYMNKDNNIKIDYRGEHKYTTNMTANDRNAAAELYNLSQILSSIEEIKKEIKEASLKIEFIQRNIERKEAN